MRHFNSLNVFPVLLAASCVLFAPNALAQTSCKGMAEKACVADKTCRWLAGYQRKDGRQVKAHCRTLPKKKAVAAKVDKKPSKP